MMHACVNYFWLIQLSAKVIDCTRQTTFTQLDRMRLVNQEQTGGGVIELARQNEQYGVSWAL